MLDQHRGKSFASLIASAPCRVELTTEMIGSLAAAPRTAAVPMEERQMPRIATARRAALDLHRPLAAFPRVVPRGQGVLTDVSLRGLRVLFDQQLYPGERVAIWLAQQELEGEVARCRRLGPCCYEIGVRLQESIPAGELKAILQDRA